MPHKDTFFKRNFERFYEKIQGEYKGALISPGPNFYYLTGLNPASTLERLFLLIVPVGSEPVILAPKLYENELKTSWIENIMLWEDKDNPYLILKEILDSTGLSDKPRCCNRLPPLAREKKLLIEDTMPLSFFYKLKQALRELDFEPLSKVVSELRVVKSKIETEFLKKAAKLADEAFEKLLEEELEGKTEREIEARIEYILKTLGAEDIAFKPSVASGPNSANPHHASSERVIKKGDLVVIDYGAKHGGYCSDITRTLAIGKVPEEAKKAYETVKEAQQEGIDMVKEGAIAKDIDLAVRDIIERHGYGKYFIHRTGHGLGLEVHEEPYISSNSETVLKEGMVFTIEPGVYIPGKFGIRIEDDIAVINKRGVTLTNAEKELLVL
ncbi:aminopeptidase P family protein [Candidatus Aerophobetes bacterium]|nr:aminopeptidase P family protein [Candidatus Aerophobetes bacterium]